MDVMILLFFSYGLGLVRRVFFVFVVAMDTVGVVC